MVNHGHFMAIFMIILLFSSQYDLSLRYNIHLQLTISFEINTENPITS